MGGGPGMVGALSRLWSKRPDALRRTIFIAKSARAFADVAAVLLVFLGSTPVSAAVGTSEATAARLVGDQKATAFELELSEGITAEVFTLANPYRVIVDLPDVTFRLQPGTGQRGQGLVSAFRYGLFAERKARVVIDTAGPVKITSARMTRMTTGSGVVLKIGLEPMDATAFGLGTGASRAPSPPEAEPRQPAAGGGATKPNGHSKPVIVIDPGHGGIDPGAVGAGAMPEKAIVLAVAQQLKAVLAQTGRYDIRMTRSSDVFISLDRRLKISTDSGADLFISLHADSIEEKAVAENIRGATIYTLSERASDEQARMMAEKENASDLIAGLESTGPGGQDQVKNILIDLMKRETSNFSADFSNVLAGKLGKTIAMSRDPQRSAAFKVLKQPHAPSVLVELGYLSNTRDQQNLGTEAWQKQVAGAIAGAVQAYFSKKTAEHP